MSTITLSKCDPNLDDYRLHSSPTVLHLYTNICTIVLNSLCSVPGIIFNSLIVVSYLTNKRLRNSSTMMFLALAICDLMVNAMVQPVFIAIKFQEIFVMDSCILGAVLRLTTYTCCGCSLGIIVILSIEHFITLAYPYHHQNIVNPTRLNLSVAAVSIMIFMSMLSHYFVPSPIHFYVAAAYLICCLIIVVFIWIWIQRLIFRHKRQIAQQQSVHLAARERQKVLSTTKSSYAIIMIILISYFPSFVTNLYTLPNGTSYGVYFFVYQWILTILYGKSTITPLILFWKKKIFCDTARRISNKLMNVGRREAPNKILNNVLLRTCQPCNLSSPLEAIGGNR